MDAKEQSQKYKVGKFILETEKVVTHRCWEDAEIEELDEPNKSREEITLYGRDGEVGEEADDEGLEEVEEEEEEVVFDSDDEDECEDVFAGTWDAETVARRRSQMVARR